MSEREIHLLGALGCVWLGIVLRLAAFDDNIPADHLDVLVAESTEHADAGIIGDGEFAVVPVLLDEVANVGDFSNPF